MLLPWPYLLIFKSDYVQFSFHFSVCLQVRGYTRQIPNNDEKNLRSISANFFFFKKAFQKSKSHFERNCCSNSQKREKDSCIHKSSVEGHAESVQDMCSPEATEMHTRLRSAPSSGTCDTRRDLRGATGGGLCHGPLIPSPTQRPFGC